MEKKAIAESIAQIARESSHTVNHLGQEVRSMGNAIGGEETGAALNAAGTAAVIGMGLIAGGAAMVVKKADSKSKAFYNKLDTYGGLGVPMDDECKVLTTVGFANWKKADLRSENGKTLPSADVIAKHISHNQDKAITRSFMDGTTIWNVFLFSKQLVRNRVAFGLSGNYPPRIELSLDEFNIGMFSEANNLTDKDLTKLIDKLRDNGAHLTASGSSLRAPGEFNLTGSFTGLEKALDILNKRPYKDIRALEPLRQRIQNELSNPTLFGFDVPRFELTPDDLSVFTSEEIEEIKSIASQQEDMSVVVRSDGVIELAGTQDGYDNLLNSLHSSSQNVSNAVAGTTGERYATLSNKIRAFCKSDEMTPFTRDLVSLKRELKGFDSIRFKINNGRCIVQTDHGLEDIVHVLMAANRVPESWDKGIKKQLSDWAKDTGNALDATNSASFIYGERQGATAVQRTLYTRVMDEELSASAEVARDQLLFIENNQSTITHLRDAELDRVVAERTRDFQTQSLAQSEAMVNAVKQSSGVTLSEESINKLAEALQRSAGR